MERMELFWCLRSSSPSRRSENFRNRQVHRMGMLQSGKGSMGAWAARIF